MSDDGQNGSEVNILTIKPSVSVVICPHKSIDFNFLTDCFLVSLMTNQMKVCPSLTVEFSLITLTSPIVTSDTLQPLLHMTPFSLCIYIVVLSTSTLLSL